MAIRYKTLKDWIQFLEEKGFKGLKVSEKTSYTSLKLTLNTSGALPPGPRKWVVLKEQLLTISFERESNLLGVINLRLTLSQRGKELTCSIKPIGGKQLDIFHNYQAEEGMQRFLSEHQKFFKLGKTGS
jgi:hypothetical protein